MLSKRVAPIHRVSSPPGVALSGAGRDARAGPLRPRRAGPPVPRGSSGAHVCVPFAYRHGQRGTSRPRLRAPGSP
eukprot:5304820-Lingulodinium_polyedra.AAC.1